MSDTMLVMLAIFVANPILWTIAIVVVVCKLVMGWQNFRDAANEWVRKLP